LGRHWAFTVGPGIVREHAVFHIVIEARSNHRPTTPLRAPSSLRPVCDAWAS
jgi:hypothetical protein